MKGQSVQGAMITLAFRTVLPWDKKSERLLVTLAFQMVLPWAKKSERLLVTLMFQSVSYAWLPMVIRVRMPKCNDDVPNSVACLACSWVIEFCVPNDNDDAPNGMMSDSESPFEREPNVFDGESSDDRGNVRPMDGAMLLATSSCCIECANTSQYYEFLMRDTQVPDQHVSYHSEASTSGNGDAVVESSLRLIVTTVQQGNPRVPMR
ncbi:hypothetical protein L3X38_005571 [Prunus dulcis]|uniref:Uncharacterized protein n=1 Tax=Prunus dulcis TaxID=3755 RepID=A0AAD4ZR67_PRUDU|nr:hypothetical protein L3X38_005571 [Prunus dulcis]